MVPLIFQLIFASNNLFISDTIRLKINDNIIIETNKNRIESIILNVEIVNYTQNEYTFNLQRGITQSGSLFGEYIPNYCETTDYQGAFRFFLFNDSSSLLQNPILSIGDYVYFNKRNKLVYVNLEGVDRPRTIRKSFRREAKQKIKDESVVIPPGGKKDFSINVFLGSYILDAKTYQFLLVYNNRSNNKFSKICLKSNLMEVKLIRK